ncbi:MAG: hypothetical protein Q8L79_07790 [Methylobacter sp.]|uniref:hypothetical protein n=1 Tax=Methylobacter sp. TaxID=2051955 RepID=UPI0027316BC0|nr:hypothetical protein [Methylobacter sp.]MDP1665015.1 hypothetical protein [Methylobacter sp.]
MKYLAKIILIAILSLCVLIVIMMGLYFRAQQLPPKPPRGKIIAQESTTVERTEMITVEFDGYRFKFPMNYGDIDPKAGVMFRGYWPGFRAVSRKKQSPEERKAQIYDGILVFIDDYCISKPPFTEKQRLENIALYQADYKRNYFEPIFNAKLGLLEYHNRRSNEAEIFMMDKSEVLSPIYGEQMVAVCRGRTRPSQEEETIGCQSVYALRPDLCVTVRFYKKHLRDWRAIHTRVLDFIETSMKAAKEE